MPRRLFVLASALLTSLALAPGVARAALPGINLQNDPSPAATQQAIDSGAKELRFFISWNALEPSGPGTFLDAVNKPQTDTDRGVAALYGQYAADTTLAKNAGVRVMIVITGAPTWASGQSNPNYPPTAAHYGDYAKFAVDFVKQIAASGGAVNTLEVWNEADGGQFWLPGPDPAGYTNLLRTTYGAMKAADGVPSVAVFASPTVGNDYGWLQALYDNGAKGAFDGVSVHTDTACSVASPDSFFRTNGRLDQFTFLGYREMAATMAANGENKPIAMSELGWSSTGGGPTSCTNGKFAGQKPSGVDFNTQASFLSKAYACLANDPNVISADWFQLKDGDESSPAEANHYGLVFQNGTAKPALGAFQAVAAANGGGPGPCGDFTAPQITVKSPTANLKFVDKLDLQASATDNGGVGVARISFYIDSASSEIRNFTAGLTDGALVGLTPWQGSGQLALGSHTVKVVALDKNGNQSEVDVPVTKVKTLASTLTPVFKLGKRVSCQKRHRNRCSLTGFLSKNGNGRPSIGGKVSVEWQWRNKKHKFRKLVGGLKPASKKFTFRAKLKKKGTWRVHVVYKGQAPYKKTTSKYLTFHVR